VLWFDRLGSFGRTILIGLVVFIEHFFKAIGSIMYSQQVTKKYGARCSNADRCAKVNPASKKYRVDIATNMYIYNSR
jgi:hypothetical protein